MLLFYGIDMSREKVQGENSPTSIELDECFKHLQDAWPAYVLVDVGNECVVRQNDASTAQLGKDVVGCNMADLFADENITTAHLIDQSQQEKKRSPFYHRRFTRKYTMKHSQKNTTSFKAIINTICMDFEDNQYLLVRIEDVSLDVKELEKLTHAANYDALTDLRNRRSFDEELTRVYQDIQDNDAHYVLLYIDIDQFKIFNDLHDHAYGDKVLVLVAQTLNTVKRRADHLFRIGGDEFVFIAKGIEEEKRMAWLAEKILKAIRQIKDTCSPTISISIGGVRINKTSIEKVGDDGRLVNHIKKADKASTIAKAPKKNLNSFTSADSI